MNERLFIIAGTVEEARDCRSRKINEMVNAGKSVSLSNFIIFDRIEQFNGQQSVHGFFTGTYRKRRDLKEIIRHIKLINKLHPSETIVPNSQPFTNHVLCTTNGLIYKPHIEYTATKSDNNMVTVVLNNAPAHGSTVGFVTTDGMTIAFDGDGFTNKFTFADCIV